MIQILFYLANNLVGYFSDPGAPLRSVQSKASESNLLGIERFNRSYREAVLDMLRVSELALSERTDGAT